MNRLSYLSRLSVLMVISFVFFACKKDEPPRLSFPISQFIEDNYRADARQLYLREVAANPWHPQHSAAELDTLEINNILRELQLIYELKTLETEAVFQNHHIRALRCISVNSINLFVDTSAVHIKSLVDTKRSGLFELDEILDRYSFDTVKVAYSYPRVNWISIYSTQSLNLIPIIEQLKTVPGISMAEPNGGCFDGNNIEMKKMGLKTIFSFSVGSGDCPAGCMMRTYWRFSIDNNKASFIGQ